MKKEIALTIGELTAPIPVVQGGMGVGISLSSLAGNVAKNGGVGVISSAQIGFRDPEWNLNPLETNLRVLKEEIQKARKIASGHGIIAVNIMVATRFYEKYVKAAVEAGVDMIISGAGLPVDLPRFVKDSKTKIAPIVSSLKSLDVITRYWSRKYNKTPDMVVIEGPLAGGHLGFKKEELADIDALCYDEEVRRIISRVRENEQDNKIPVVVAGGIYEAKDALPYFEMGADGVQVATRFVTTYECDADIRYKEAYINSKKEDIEIVKSPVGMPGRAIHNAFLDKVAAKGSAAENSAQETDAVSNVSISGSSAWKCHQCLAKCNPAEIPYCITDALVNAAKGNTQDGLLFCGANAWKATKLEHVSDIMKEFEEELA
ncbi:MAG: nitronate monooxygenase [Lachnospiraceae bacterium]|nr:nitronate monooxygenase [Lachnospiraceae bacterium]